MFFLLKCIKQNNFETQNNWRNGKGDNFHNFPVFFLCVIFPSICNSICNSFFFFLSMLSTGSNKVHDNSGEEEFLNLMYDPCLNCYFDPQSGKYYELL